MGRRRLLCAVVCGLSGVVAVTGVGSGTVQAAGFTVTNLNDSGPGSLRQAIIDADANPGLDDVTFAAGLSGEISLTSGSIAPTDAINITGPGASSLSVAGDATASVIAVTSAVQVVISGLTITNGGGVGTNSGGVYVNNAGADVTIRNSVLTGNTGFYGGGVSDYTGQLLIQDSRITGNTATGSGGGLATATNTTLERVEISDNTAVLSGAGVFLNSGVVVIDNSTISGNTAPAGGGVYRFSAGAQLTVNSSTIVDNQSTDGSAGGISGSSGSSTVSNSIVSGNSSSDISGQINVAWSFITDASGATVTDLGGNVFGADPQLEGLAFNGGLTRTHFPTSSSPVIDAGDPSLTNPALDQRGALRVARSTASGPERIDIGAVEVVPMDDEWQTDEDTVLTVADPGVLFSDNRGYTVELVDAPANGQVALNATGGFTYTPSRNFSGSDSFTYRLVGTGAPDYISTVTIDVTEVIDPFQLADDSGQFVNDGTPVTIDVLANDSGENLTIASVTQGQLGTVATDGSIVIYTPNQGAVGTDTFQYVATDGTSQATATVTISLTAPTAITTTTTAAPPTSTVPGGSTPAPPTTSLPVGELPATGSDTLALLAFAAGALTLGTAIARVARRRPS